MFDELRSNREVLGHLDEKIKMADLAVFLGLFNATAYLSSLEKQLESQTVALPIIIVDNQSEDDTWSTIQKWLVKFEGRILLVRNAINLGGTGTLLANADLIPSTWVATLHQDDFYKPNHLATLKNRIDASVERDIAFATDMGSMSAAGKPTLSPPRASWFIPDTSPATMFLANLRLHNFPFPAGAFRVTALLTARNPWHSTVFPDTELVLKWALEGNLVHIAVETMLYRENPASESHTVNEEERDLGTYLSLTRVFGLPEFGDLVEGLPASDHSYFFSSLIGAINFRIRDESLSDLLSLQVAEVCAYRWGYAEAQSNQVIIDASKKVNAVRTSALVTSLGNFYALEITQNYDVRSAGKPAIHAVRKQGALLRIALWVFGMLPYKTRRFLATSVMKRLLTYWKVDSPWKMDWRS